MRIDPVLQAVVEAAVNAAAARDGWVAAVEGDRFRLVAAAGERAGRLLGATAGLEEGTAGYVVASGQPLAIASSRLDTEPRLREGIAASLGREVFGVLSVPCATADGTVGALELVDKSDGGSFSIDDLEIAAMLGPIAAAALRSSSAGAAEVPSAAQLSAQLDALAATAPARYATIAAVVGALLTRE
jgi:GAF domain-containing protein